MEQIVIEKMEKATNELYNKINDYNLDFDDFTKEFFTDDMYEIIKTVVDSTGNGLIDCGVIMGEHFFVSRSCFISTSTYTLGKFAHQKYSFNEGGLMRLKVTVDNLKQAQERLLKIQEIAPQLAECVMNKYNEISQKQSDTVDEVLEMLGVEDEKSKHIKITVEWV